MESLESLERLLDVHQRPRPLSPSSPTEEKPEIEQLAQRYVCIHSINYMLRKLFLRNNNLQLWIMHWPISVFWCCLLLLH